MDSKLYKCYLKKQKSFYHNNNHNHNHNHDHNFDNNLNINSKFDGICFDMIKNNCNNTSNICNPCKHGNICKYRKDYNANINMCEHGNDCAYRNTNCLFLHPDETKLEYFYKINLLNKLDDLKDTILSDVLIDLMKIITKQKLLIKTMEYKFDNLEKKIYNNIDRNINDTISFKINEIIQQNNNYLMNHFSNIIEEKEKQRYNEKQLFLEYQKKIEKEKELIYNEIIDIKEKLLFLQK